MTLQAVQLGKPMYSVKLQIGSELLLKFTLLAWSTTLKYVKSIRLIKYRSFGRIFHIILIKLREIVSGQTVNQFTSEFGSEREAIS